MKAEEEEDKSREDSGIWAIANSLPPRLLPFPLVLTAMRQWERDKYAMLKATWATRDSVVWLGEESTAEFTARLTCQAWLYEMLVVDPDPGIKHVTLFTETRHEAEMACKGLLGLLNERNIPLVIANKEAIRTLGGRHVDFVPMMRHTTRGVGGHRIIMLVHQENYPEKGNPRKTEMSETITRFLRDVITPLLDLTVAKFVVYGIPKR